MVKKGKWEIQSARSGGRTCNITLQSGKVHFAFSMGEASSGCFCAFLFFLFSPPPVPLPSVQTAINQMMCWQPSANTRSAEGCWRPARPVRGSAAFDPPARALSLSLSRRRFFLFSFANSRSRPVAAPGGGSALPGDLAPTWPGRPGAGGGGGRPQPRADGAAAATSCAPPPPRPGSGKEGPRCRCRRGGQEPPPPPPPRPPFAAASGAGRPPEAARLEKRESRWSISAALGRKLRAPASCLGVCFFPLSSPRPFSPCTGEYHFSRFFAPVSPVLTAVRWRYFSFGKGRPFA